MASDIWVISDTHFGHKNILNFTNEDGSPLRDFSSVEEMDEYMIDKWNSVVKPQDKVYHLGDVFFGSFSHYETNIHPRLNGKKRLVVGNHDNIKRLAPLFQKVVMWRVMGLDGLLLSHTPQHPQALTANRKGLYNVHGHIHSRPAPEGDYKCVCVEQVDYTPVNLDELRSEAKGSKA